MQLNRPIRSRPRPNGLPRLPIGSPERPVASDRSSSTLDNGLATPRAELHIALLAADRETADLLRERVRVVKPPYWDGKVHLHIIREDLRGAKANVDFAVVQAVIDLGWGKSTDFNVGPPDDTSEGYG